MSTVIKTIMTVLLSTALLAGTFSTPSFAGGVVALTFDDGPDKKLTPWLLDILRQEGVVATFYVVGRRAEMYPDILRRMKREGHEIGNHTWSHPKLTAISNVRVVAELKKTDEVIMATTGVRPRTIRPPYGEVNARVRKADHRPFVCWHVDTLDWLKRNSERIVRVGSTRSEDKSVVLMHDIHASTVRAIPALIRELKSRGFRFVTVSEVPIASCSFNNLVSR